MFDNYFMLMTDPADPVRAKGARRITLAEARDKITNAPEDVVVYISKGLHTLLALPESEYLEKTASVFEAYV